jgi:CHAD domain-containing protein
LLIHPTVATVKGGDAPRGAGEALASHCGKAAKIEASRMETTQEIPGAYQDTLVIRDQIRQLAVFAHLDGENAFTYGSGTSTHID